MKKILVAVDFSDDCLESIEYAKSWANKLNGTLTLAYIDTLTAQLNSMPVTPLHYGDHPKDDSRKSFIDEVSQARMEQLLAKASLKSDEVETRIIEAEKAEKGLIHCIEQDNIDLLILRGKKHDLLSRLFMGSLTDKMAHLCPVPLVVYKGGKEHVPQCILVPVDFSPITEKIKERSAALSKELGAEVIFTHIINSSINDYVGATYYVKDIDEINLAEIMRNQEVLAQKRCKEFVDYVKAQGGQADYEVKLALDIDVPSYIEKLAEEKNCGLIIMGAHSKTGLEKFLIGSVTNKIVRKSHLPLMILR